MINRLETQQCTATTHILESQVRAWSVGLNQSNALQPLTHWGAKNRHDHSAWNTAMHFSHSQPEGPRTGMICRLKTQKGTAATHSLESQGQAWSVGLKHRKALQLLTAWRAKNRHDQQTWNKAMHCSLSQPEDPRTGMISRLETQQGTAATHSLESQRQAWSVGLKHRKALQPLTDWRTKDRHDQ